MSRGSKRGQIVHQPIGLAFIWPGLSSSGLFKIARTFPIGHIPGIYHGAPENSQKSIQK